MRTFGWSCLTGLLLGISVTGSAAQTQPAAESAPQSLNLLTAPSAPAFVLLGIEPTSIERPGSVTDVALSLRSATDDFSVLPESYAISVAPYWLTPAANNLDFDTYASGRGAWLRTATLSLATTTSTDETSGEQTTSLGVGLRVSLVQGAIAQDSAYVASIDYLRTVMDLLADSVSVLHVAKLTTDPALLALEDSSDAAAAGSPERQRWEEMIQVRTLQLVQEADDELRGTFRDEIQDLRRAAAGLPLRRTGFNLDLAVGAVVDFLGGDFDARNFRTGGAWLTGSVEYPWGAALGVARWLRDADADVESFDLGGRVVLDNIQGLSLSAEGLGRFFPNVDGRDKEWRVAVSADYSVGGNRLLTFTFGRDFEGRSDSDLILAINLAVGFGSLRPAF